MDALPGIRYSSAILAAAGANGLDPAFLAAVAAQETGGPGADSGANVVGDGGHGHGLFQIDDRYHAFARTPGAADPAQNAAYAAGLLGGLLERNGGNVRAALSAYNAGSPNALGTVTTWPDGAQLGYADSVLRHYAAIRSEVQQRALDELPTTSADVNQLGSYAGQIPQVTLPAFTPPNWSFTSYASESDKGGGKLAATSDQAMAALVDPSDDPESR